MSERLYLIVISLTEAFQISKKHFWINAARMPDSNGANAVLGLRQLARFRVRELRRLAEMTQQRSFEVTRVRNGIRDGTRRIIHAAGVCVDVRERKSNIIHAAGVRGGFTSSAPRARNALRSQEKLSARRRRFDCGGGQDKPAQSICRAAKLSSCPAAKPHPTGRGGGSLLASKVGYYVEFRIMVSQGLRDAGDEALMLFRG